MLKLYVVVRNDLDCAFQMCQVAHAVANFATEHPKEFKAWNSGNNTICVLQATSDKTLQKLIDAAEDGDFTHTAFYESEKGGYDIQIDIGPWLTAVAFAPNWTVQNVLLADLPLALNEKTVKAMVGLGKGFVAVDAAQFDHAREKSKKLYWLEEASPSVRRRYFKNLKKGN